MGFLKSLLGLGGEDATAKNDDNKSKEFDVLKYDGVRTLRGADLSGKTVALFGCGDSESYPDTFAGGMGELYQAVVGAGAHVVGAVPVDGYTFDSSDAVVDGHFVGLALDEVNESDKTDARIDAWAAAITPSL